MKYRLIASDMDGTLLTTQKTIAPANAAAIHRAEEAGVIFCLASGRPLYGLKKYIGQLSLSSPVIVCNGAVIMKPDGEVLHRQTIAALAARGVFAFARRFDVTCCVWSNERLFFDRTNERTEQYRHSMQIEDFSVVEGWEEVIDAGIDKILWHSEADQVEGYQEILRRELSGEVNFFTSNPRYLEFVDRGVTKGTALRRLAGLYGLDISQTIAVGDGYNDLEMLRTAGLGVAMGNAPGEIKRQCGWVAPTNDEDGIAAVIERFIGV